MTASEIFQALEPFVKSNSSSVSTTVSSKRGFETVYSVDYSIKQEDHPTVYISVSFFVILNNETLLQRVAAKAEQGKVSPLVDKESIRHFVEKQNLKMLPYLKLYSQQETDYDLLAELYLNSRGTIAGNKFGF